MQTPPARPRRLRCGSAESKTFSCSTATTFRATKPLRETFDEFLRQQYGGRIEKGQRIGRLKSHPIVFTT